MEYPPGALTVFLPPAVFGTDHYNAAFKLLMALCGVATIAVVALLLERLAVPRLMLVAALGLLALSPIALGPISLNTYDAWPALLTVAGLAAVLGRKPVLGLGLLGLAFAAKVYPLVVLPPVLIFVWRTAGRRIALRALSAFVGVAAVLVVPFLVLSPHGLEESFRAQAARSLQVESLGGALLGAADRLGWYSATVVHHTKPAISYDLAGSLPHALAALSSAAQVLAVLAVALLYLRGPDDPRRLVAAAAAAVAGFLAFTRFFSPQYLVWVVPLAALLGPSAWVLTGAAMVLAQVWFFHYGHVFALEGYIWLVLARDALVVALFAVALRSLRRSTAEEQHAVLLEDQAPLRAPT
jgi:uncharacterized membrane protein